MAEALCREIVWTVYNWGIVPETGRARQAGRKPRGSRR